LEKEFLFHQEVFLQKLFEKTVSLLLALLILSPGGREMQERPPPRKT